jgi:hypothetical protein
MKFLLHTAAKIADPVSWFLSHIAEVKPFQTGDRAAGFDLFVLDAGACAAAADMVREALEGGTAVLVLDAGDEQKTVLHDIIGFRSAGPGAGYLVVPIPDGNGRTHYQILEQRYPTRVQSLIRRSAAGEGEGLTEESDPLEIDLSREEGCEYLFELSQEQLKSFGEKVRDVLRSPRTIPAQDIPAGLKSRSWVYSEDQSFTASGGKTSVGKPKKQDISCFTTYEFQAFLNNWPESGAFQYVYLRQSGIYQTNGMVKNNNHERGWYLTQLAPTFTPPPELFYYQSSPANTAGSKDVTTSTGFQIDFNTGGAGASYNFSKSSTERIYDWQIVQKTGMSWQYFQATPYSGKQVKWPDSAVESNDKGEIKPMPTISKYSLQFDIQTVWKTNGIVRRSVPIQTSNYLKTDYLMTEYFSGTKWEGTWWEYPITWPGTYYIDLALVS